MPIERTILSAGRVINALLTADADVMRLTRGKPPVSSLGKDLTPPYVVYWRSGLTSTPNNMGTANAANMEVLCVGSTYEESVDLAEAVNAVLNGARCEGMRACYLVDAKESPAADAHEQQLTYLIRI